MKMRLADLEHETNPLKQRVPVATANGWPAAKRLVHRLIDFITAGEDNYQIIVETSGYKGGS